MQSKISIILPIVREDKAERCIEAIRENAGIPIDQYEIVQEVDHDRVGCPEMVKRLVEKTKHDLVMFLGDDTIPQKDFLKEALKVMETLPDGWGLAALEDGIQDPNRIATHWLASKRLLPLIGGEFFSTEYKHNFCDQELTIKCKDLGRYAPAYNSAIEHKHFLTDRSLFDKDYRDASGNNAMMIDRATFDRRISAYRKSRDVWFLKKIPRVLHLYWGRNKKLSFMKYLTAYSFSKQNPDWEIRVHFPKSPFIGENWADKTQKGYNFKGADYFDKLSDIPNLTLHEVDFDEDFDFDTGIPEVFRSDLYRIKLLGDHGGFWSDFDIIFIRSMNHMDLNTIENRDSDAVVCCHHGLNRIGFLGSAPGKPNFFSSIMDLHNYYRDKGLADADLDDYQAFGRYLFDNHFMYNEEARTNLLKTDGISVRNIHMDTVYPILSHEMDKLYSNDFPIREKTIGIHWYAGDPKTSKYENDVDYHNIGAFDEKIIFSLMKSVYIGEKLKYSIIMPYHSRSDQLHNTLVSYKYFYEGRDDYELIIVEDSKNVADDLEHKKMMDVLKAFKGTLNMKLIQANEVRTYNPAPLYNLGFEYAEGKFIVLTSPECFHENNILDRLDSVLTYHDDIYAVCSCKHVGLYPKRIEKFDDFDYTNLGWYHHSVHKDSKLNFLSAISAYNFKLLGGFDDRFMYGIDFDDTDFRENIRRNNIEILDLDDVAVAHQKHKKDPDVFDHDEKGALYLKNKALFDRKNRREFKLGIGLPHTDKTVGSYFFDSWVVMEKPDFTYMRPPYTGYVGMDLARNSLVKDALESGCSHLLMMDTDQVYPRDTITKLLSHNKKVIGPLIHRRYPPFDPVLYKGKVGEYAHVDDEASYSGRLIEIDATGCGCVLYDMDVFLKIQPPWFETYQLESGKLVGEDINFCAKLRDAGFKIFVDTSIEIEHMATMGVNRSTHEIYKKSHRFQWKRVEGA